MSLGRLYAVPQDLSALKALAESAKDDGSSGGGGTPSDGGIKKRKSTKKNPGPKLHVSGGLKGEDLAADYEGDDGDDDYDEEDLGAGALSAASSYSGLARAPSAISFAEYKKEVKSLLAEFSRSGHVEVLLSGVHNLSSPAFHAEFVKRALTAGIEGNDGQRENLSLVLSNLYGLDITMLQIGEGFERLLESLDDLSLDAPNAKEVAGKFIARAIADEILPPAFLQDPHVEALCKEAVDYARTLLTVPHAYSRLSTCWGITGGTRTVEELKEAVKKTVMELLVEGGVDEAVRCVRELSVPHFSHEVVYRLLILALEAYPNETKFKFALDFLKRAVPSPISAMQCTLGFKRAAAALADLEKDAPKAKAGFRKLFEQAEAAGILSKDAAATATATA